MLTNLTIIGIDPGKSGGIALIYPDGTAEAHPFSEGELREICQQEYRTAIAFIENVHAMPGQGVTSMFNFGQNFGYIKGMIEAHAIPYELVNPQKWKRMFSVTSDKNTSVSVCKRLFPDVSLLRTERCKKEHDGMAEALLIAEWGRRNINR